VGIIQSNYIPWRGYFDFIDDVDLFIFHDDLQYTKGDWRNRNRIRGARGLIWLTVPVHYRETKQRICDTEIVYSSNWQQSHLNLIRANYGNAPHVDDALQLLSEAFAHKDRTISQLNRRLVVAVATYLGITTPTRESAEFALTGQKTERILALMRKVGADTYLSGPTAQNYLDEEQLSRAGIALEYKSYDYMPYPQQGDGFEANVSVLDLIANCGHGARNYVKSKTPNRAHHIT
jgi:hypothetical protein